MFSALPLHLFNFKGRIGRLSYFIYGLATVAFGAGGAWLAFLLTTSDNAIIFVAVALMALVLIAAYWLALSLTVKRMHDLGKPGTLLIALFITVAIATVIDHSHVFEALLTITFNAWLFLAPGQAEVNEWGSPPSGTEARVPSE